MGIFADIFIIPDIVAAGRRARVELARKRKYELRRRKVEALEKIADDDRDR